jgi:cell division protein FtsB
LKKLEFDFLDKNEFDYKLLFVVFAIISVGIYIGFLIYGARGLDRYIDLKNQNEMLAKRVKSLQKENVKLQREYFGLKDIEGDE